MGEIDVLLRDLKKCGNAGRDCALAAEDALTIAAALEAAREDAERWRFVRRKLCLTGNGNGTCGMQALNLPAAIPGWPEPGKVAEFCDAAIDHAIWKENGDE